MAERDADAIRRDIEKARVSLADSVDEIAYRADPKRIADNAKTTLREKAQSPQGKAVLGGVAVVVVLLVVRRVRRARR